MSTRHDLSLIFAFILCGSLAATSQSNSPEAALEELAATDKLETLARHLPLAVEQSISRLGPMDKAALEQQIVVPRLLPLFGYNLQKRADGSGWEFQFRGQAEPEIVRVKATFYAGGEALLLLRSNDEDYPLGLVSMRSEDGEWRITDFGFAHMEGIEARLAQKLRPGAAQEAEIVGELQTIQAALIEYAGIYPEVGYPERLAAVGPAPKNDASSAIAVTLSSAAEEIGEKGERSAMKRPPADHAELLDSSYLAEPLVKHGYRIRYTLIAAHGGGGDDEDSRGRYSITAMPVEFGKTGSRSFYTDETGAIHVTEDNREATVYDPPAPRRRFGHW